MDEVIGKASSMKPARVAVQEYDTELPLDIYFWSAVLYAM